MKSIRIDIDSQPYGQPDKLPAIANGSIYHTTSVSPLKEALRLLAAPFLQLIFLKIKSCIVTGNEQQKQVNCLMSFFPCQKSGLNIIPCKRHECHLSIFYKPKLEKFDTLINPTTPFPFK